LSLKDIKLLGRTTQGVTIMRMNGDDKIVSIGLMPESTPEGSDEG
jgi:hypothetical protein